MADLTFVTFEEMWEELKRRQENGLYIALVIGIAWRSDFKGEQRPSGSQEASNSFWIGGYHNALGLIEACKSRMLELRGRTEIEKEPPDIEKG